MNTLRKKEMIKCVVISCVIQAIIWIFIKSDLWLLVMLGELLRYLFTIAGVVITVITIRNSITVQIDGE